LNNKDIILAFADLVTLLYHEERNVRHLVKKGHLIDPKFLSLRERLATNRCQAWKQIQSLRLEARKARSHKEIELIFEQHFKLTLNDLVFLYAHPSWKGTPYGGNAWLPIARKVKEVRDLLDSGREDEANCLMNLILQMSHNTGKVSEKLKNLDSC
jgi:hypothetical protein